MINNEKEKIMNKYNKVFTEALNQLDKHVVDAFYNGEAMEGRILNTDG